MSTFLREPNGDLSLNSLCSTLLSHKYMDVVAKTLAWNGSPTTQGRAELALPLLKPPRLTEDAQFIRMRAMAVYKGRARLGDGPSALWFE